jgi:serine/threonine-protein kinase
MSDPASRTVTRETDAARDDLARLTLTAVEGPHKGQVFTLAEHEVFLAGRSKTAHLRLQDDHCSRSHFLVEFNPPHCRMTDLGSRNGTWVNGQRVQTTDLRDGDVIRAGQTHLAVAIQFPTAAASPSMATQCLPAGDVVVTTAPETVPPFPADAALPLPPAFPRVAGYEILRVLGQGGMGIVHLARCQADGSLVALKMITPAAAVQRHQTERFLREVCILRELRHPHIVTFRDVGESEGRLFFAMDYIEGTDAARMLGEQGPLPVRTAVRLLCQVLVALGYAHEKGFVHRDVKPANILVAGGAGKKVVKLADFGLARVYQESRLSGLTMHGDVGGTVAFMPPEQITHFRLAKPPADQYSAAATLYTLLTGRTLFNFSDPSVPPLTRVLEEEPVPIRQRRPELPDDLAAVIHQALAKDPGGRFPDALALRAALKPFGR